MLHDSSSSCALSIATMLALLVLPAPSRAAHPYVTDDTGTQGSGKWQLELLGEHNRHDRTATPGGFAVNQVRRVTVINGVLTYGMLDHVDVAVGGNHLRQSVREDGTLLQSARGLSDSTLELKWRFYEADGLSLALKPGLALPTGDENRALGSGKLSGGLNAILTYEARPWTWLANVAYYQARFKLPEDASANRRHLWRFSAGVAYAVHEKLRIAGEVGLRTNPARDDPFLPGRNGNFAMLGLIYSVSESLDLDVGLRRSANRAEFDTAFLLGATVRW